MALYDVLGNRVSQVFNVGGHAVEETYPAIAMPDHNLVVMSFNIQRWRGINADTAILDKIFRKYNPDVVGFQEYDTSKTLGGESLPRFLSRFWPYLEVGETQIENYTKAVATSYKPDDAITVYYTEYNESRSYQKMYIEVPGRRVAVFNTHLDYTTSTASTTTKVKQAAELFEAVKDEEYFIIIGDLNTICTDTSDADYLNIMKQFVDAGYHCANCTDQFGFFNTWNGSTDGSGAWEQTDHVITSANISINSVVVDRTKIEENTGLTIDHLPLIAYLAVK